MLFAYFVVKVKFILVELEMYSAYFCFLWLTFILSIVRTENKQFGKYTFPDDFLFGVASSAYQIEGGHDADGKGANIWDHYTKHYPEKFKYGNGNVACDSYKKYQDDVQLISDLGAQFYRFSISWSRILPNGYSNKINKEGVKYYDRLINALLAKGIQPLVTMYHWDLPMTLQEIGGWTNPNLAYYFEDYARILFTTFGDRVKFWITLNTGCSGYGDDKNSYFPPFVKQPGITNYLCKHVMLLAHAKAYHLYDEEFRYKQNGKVGIVSDGRYNQPASDSLQDIDAAERVTQFLLGLTLNPIFNVDGDYPKILKDRIANISKREGYLRSRLPRLSNEEKYYIQGTYDFLGLNVYTTFLVEHKEYEITEEASMQKDMGAHLFHNDSWEKSNSNWLRVYPQGTRKLLKWVKDKYDDPEIIITENGFSDKGEINDLKRIQYLQRYMNAILESIYEDGVNIKGYAVWSLLDNFEWLSGYREKFGLYQVDFSRKDRRRTPKKSAKWYRNVIKARRIIDLDEISSRLKGDL